MRWLERLCCAECTTECFIEGSNVCLGSISRRCAPDYPVRIRYKDVRRRVGLWDFLLGKHGDAFPERFGKRLLDSRPAGHWEITSMQCRKCGLAWKQSAAKRNGLRKGNVRVQAENGRLKMLCGGMLGMRCAKVLCGCKPRRGCWKRYAGARRK